MRISRSMLKAAAAVVFVPGIAVASPVQAQDAAPTTAPVDETSGDGDIVVTALKRSQSLQDVPASISAVSGDDLSAKGLSDIRDIAKVIPNLNWGEHFGTTLITIRGAGSNVDSGATEPTVALYVDGIYLPRSDMATFRAVDLDRVEVLRGPQGTLYGRNATGGAINFVSQQPTEELTGKIEVSTGSRDAIGVNGYVSGSIAPGVAVRVSGGREKQDGYVRVLNTGQQLNGVDTIYGRFALAIEPVGSDLRNETSLRYERNKAAVAYQQAIGPLVFPAVTYIAEPNKILADGPFGGRRETFIASNVLTWEASDDLTIKSLTGYIDHNSHAAVDADGSLVRFQDVFDFVRTSKSISQEVNFVGTSGNLDWIVGLYYFHEKYYGNLPVTLQADLAPAQGLPVGATINLGQRANINNYAAFLDLNYRFNDVVSANLGMRYNYEDNKYREIFSLDPIVPEFEGAFTSKGGKFIPKIALKFDLADDVQSYIQWSKGYKSGGVNLPGGAGTILPLYRPEEMSAFEAGIKSQFLDRTVTLNVAAWYYDYKDLQITRNVPPATTEVNNADAEIYGVEAELRWNPTRNLNLFVAPTWQHAVFKDFTTFDSVTAQQVDLDGSPLPRAPKFTVNAGISNEFDLGGQLLSSLRLDANLLHSSRVVLRYENQNPLESQKPYTIVNFSASLTDASEKTQLTAFLNNAFNVDYKQNVINFGIGFMGNYGPPRTWGLKLSRKF
ncbi:iron complex outermembrane recepter protein [Sphingopyxis sp. YR583]|uniref:TonB-dependent receptor n=1 Tax=Sphingopyxis sp. YR583 TaxID=1881047 RepID=UPI0008A738AE|nr:TonB-dependent receptor [Sphingopyxis sp. YR583]SEH19231.1 iron complex outermembrane recepter protein [Sphingopyxis sp. YR583]